MKIIFQILINLIFFQSIYTSAIADIKKYIGDPNPVDIVYDCIDPTDNLKTVMNVGFNKIEPLKTSFGIKNIIEMPGLGNGLGFTSFGNAFYLVDYAEKEKQLLWTGYSDGIFWVNLMNLIDKDLGSSKNINIPMLGYTWDITGVENEKMGSLLWSLYDAYENGENVNDIRKKMVDIDDYVYGKLIPKFFNLNPAFQTSYNCNIGKYVPEK